MAFSAPSKICLKSVFNNKYLHLQQDRGTNTYGVMQFNEASVLNEYVQLEVVKADKGNDLFHLKCRFNNKFLVRWLPDRYWISASADKPNEDETSWSCTLFKPILVKDGDIKQIRLQHVQIGNNLIVWTAPGFDSALLVGSYDTPEPNNRDLLNVVDWESLLKLPKRVAFKARGNNLHLGVAEIGGADKRPYLRFVYKNPKEPKAEHEVFQSSDGIVCFKNTSTGKYWTLIKDPGRDRILAQADHDPRVDNDVNGMFRLHPVDINTVSLLNMSKKWHCKCHSYAKPGTDYYFCATTQNIDNWAILEVIDLDKLA